jgi:aminopeptidase N
MRDTFTMDNSRHPGDYDTKKHFLTLSRLMFFMFLAMFVCSLVAVALLVYNFAVCPQDEDVKVCSDLLHLNGNSSPVSSSSISPLTTIGETTEPPMIKDVRLPRAIKPISYDIVIVPNLSGENFTFEGDIAIKLHVDASCRNITLHSWTLKIRRDFVKIFTLEGNGTDGDEVYVKDQFFVEEKQFLVIETKDELQKGKDYLLKMKYMGQITDNLQGFYKSSYTVNGETKWLASTQFQSTDARRAFPCLDEPEFKATFKITLGRPKTMITLSNMPLESTETRIDRVSTPLPDYVYDVYPESVKMSTYLVAFVVCDFVNNTDGTVSVWARSDTIQSTNYALSIAPKIIKFLEDFFDIKYPLPKTDLIAIPDFAFGAMENFGLITFRETAMLYDVSCGVN